MSAPLLTARTREGAAKLALAASSVAPVGSGYERSLCPCESGFSRLASPIGKERDLMTAPLLTARAREGAKLALAASSVAHVASGYARSLRPSESGFSRLASAIGKERDL